MIIAFFTPYYKFLQRGNYLKFFNEVKSLSDLISKIKIEDKVRIYAHSKDVIKFQFGNTNPNVEYEFLEDDILFDGFVGGDDKVRLKVRPELHKVLGEYVYLVQDRDLLIQTVNEHDVLAFQATDINKLTENITKSGEIGEELTTKMFLTDKELNEWLMKVA